jgi:hypothetical protein
MRLRILLLIVIALASFQCSKKNTTSSNPASVEDLIIKDNEISGWRRAGEGWVASSETDLYGRIDGAAPPYVQHGFVEAAEQYYTGKILQDTVTVGLRITDLGKDTNAKALFDELVNGTNGMINPETWQNDKLQEAKIERTQSIRILAWKSRYCVSLNVTSNLNEAMEVLKTFGINVGSKIK